MKKFFLSLFLSLLFLGLGKFTNKVYAQKIKKFPALHYEFYIEQLNKNTPIQLDYNEDVQKYINIFIEQRSDKVAEYLKLSEYYFPIFESYLDKYNLPLELKYLAVVESGLDPLARSSSGAMGLWQLLYNSAKLLGLEITSYRDERCDVYLSTDAACRYLSYLYSLFHDWQLAIAAYNGGPGEVRNAIARSGGKTNFWELQPFLPEQTRWYVPAFIAIIYVMNYAKEHGIYPVKTSFFASSVDTIHIHYSADFIKIAKKIDISIELLRKLNPVYRKDFIPEASKPQILVLPSDKVLTFIKYENQIYTYSDTLDLQKKMQLSHDTTNKFAYWYKVKEGDFLHKIALEYNCNPESIIYWNKLPNTQLKVGQKLLLWLTNQNNNTYKMQLANDEKYYYYKVKKGDTLYSIAERFKCDSIQDIQLVNNIRSEKDLKAGQTIKIRVK